MLAEFIRKNSSPGTGHRSGKKPVQSAASRDGGQDGYPAGYETGRLWSRCLESESARLSLNDSFTLVFTGTLHEDNLKKALGCVAEKHDALRCRFGNSAIGYSFRIQLILLLNCLMLQPLAKQGRGRRLAACTPACFRDLSTRHLLPCSGRALIKTAADTWLLLFVSSSLIVDRWAMDVLISDIVSFTMILSRGNRLKHR